MINIAVSEKGKGAEATVSTLQKTSAWLTEKTDRLDEVEMAQQEGEQFAKLYNVLFLEADASTDTRQAAALRSCSDDLHFIVLCHEDANPLNWVRPDIRPSGLERFPLAQARAESILQELASAIQEDATQPKFCIRKSGMEKYVELDKILYFEARAKKMLLNTYGQIIEFYASFRDVEAQTSENFFRCHKGFMVNLDHVVQVDYTRMKIGLDDGNEIDLSRSAKAAMQEAMKNRKGDG